MISSNEFNGLVKLNVKKAKGTPPTIKAPKMPKAAKQRLVPYQSPQRRSSTATS